MNQIGKKTAQRTENDCAVPKTRHVVYSRNGDTNISQHEKRPRKIHQAHAPLGKMFGAEENQVEKGVFGIRCRRRFLDILSAVKRLRETNEVDDKNGKLDVGRDVEAPPPTQVLSDEPADKGCKMGPLK